jgi:dihydroorotate dehydrogenase (fumarate)
MNIDLRTRYLGLQLSNPVVVSACPLTGELDVLRRLEGYGAAAAVLPSLFEEQLEAPAVPPATVDKSAAVEFQQAAAYYHELRQYNHGPEAYLKYVTAAKQAVAIPIIGSLNVNRLGDWVTYARKIEEAGADALELNAYFLTTDFETTARDVEARYVELVAAVREAISLPLSVKIGPQFTALPNMARRLVDAGADGLVLFNRFLQPDIDLDTLRVVPRLTLSTPEEIRGTLRWIALLHGRIDGSLAATTGAHFADDVIRLVMAGADVVMVCSTLYRHGIETLEPLIGGLRYWLEAHDYQSIDQIRGVLSHRRCPDSAALARANHTKAITGFATDSQFTAMP